MRDIRRSLVGLLALAAAGWGAEIDGTVLTAMGPVSGATVAVNSRVSVPATAPFSILARTGADGKFAAKGLPAGTYSVCPELPSSDLLATCTWSATWPTATVTANQTVTLAPITLALGVHLRLRLDDPSGLLKTGAAGAGVETWVTAGGGRQIPMRAVARGAGEDRDIVVPAGTAAGLLVRSGKFAVADANGVAIDKKVGLNQAVPIAATGGTVVAPGAAAGQSTAGAAAGAPGAGVTIPLPPTPVFVNFTVTGRLP